MGLLDMETRWSQLRICPGSSKPHIGGGGSLESEESSANGGWNVPFATTYCELTCRASLL